MKAPATNAALPAIDLLLLKNHLFVDPNLRPTKSASPSPTAIVAIDTIPMGESVQENRVKKSRMTQYINGPPKASLESPDLEIAPARSDSFPTALPFTDLDFSSEVPAM